MTAPTMRPSAPDAPLAAREVPTVPAPGPCQEDALVAAMLKRDAAVREALDASRHLDDAGKYRAMVRYEAERLRLRAMRTAD